MIEILHDCIYPKMPNPRKHRSRQIPSRRNWTDILRASQPMTNRPAYDSLRFQLCRRRASIERLLAAACSSCSWEYLKYNSLPAPLNYPFRYPIYQLVETARSLMEVHWQVSVENLSGADYEALEGPRRESPGASVAYTWG